MNKIFGLRTFCFIVMFSMTPYALGQPKTQPIDPITEQLSLEALHNLPFIDIATGFAVPLEKAPSVASVITAEDIAAMGALTLDQVLDTVPGVHVQPSILGPSNVVSIRGIYTSRNPQVLVLMNGHRISSDAASGAFPSSAIINVRNISRIEIVRGPGSAVYGADAYAGVINIITKSARELKGFSTGVRVGSFKTKNIWGHYGGKMVNDWQLAVNLEYIKQAADRSREITSDAQTSLDNLFDTSASLAPSYYDRRYEATTYNFHLNNENWKIGLDGWSQRNIGQGAGVASALDHNGNADIDEMLFSLEYENKDWHNDMEFNAKFSYQYLDQQYFLDIFPAGHISLVGSDGNLFTEPFNRVSFPDGVLGNPGRTTKTPQLDLTFMYTGMDSHTWRFNLGGKHEGFEANESKNFGPGIIDGSEAVVDGSLTDITDTAYVYIPNKNRTVKYISIQDLWEISPDWSLTAGVRYDSYSDFGGTTNPRLALVWTATEDLIIKLLYGKAFRAPNFNELYGQNNPVALGNSSLEPETIDTYEVAFSYEAAYNLQTNFSFYLFKTKDMIDFIENDSGNKVAQNIDSILGRGLEFELNWKIRKGLTLMANYAYQQTINDETHKQQPYVPIHQLFLDARWTFKPDWHASAQLSWVGKRKREAGDNRKDIDDYVLLNLNLRKKNIAKNWEIAASIKNVFDKSVYEPSASSIPNDYSMNKRSAFIELSHHY